MQMRKRGTPNTHPTPYNGGGGGSVNNSFSSKRQTEEKVDQQPGLVVHGTVSAADAAAGVKSATLVAPVLKLLKEVCAGRMLSEFHTHTHTHRPASPTATTSSCRPISLPASRRRPPKDSPTRLLTTSCASTSAWTRPFLCMHTRCKMKYFPFRFSLTVPHIHTHAHSGEEDFRASVVVHCSTWLDAESGIAKLRNTPLPYTHTATALEAPKETVHCTLVLKNLPFGLKHEALMEDLVWVSLHSVWLAVPSLTHTHTRAHLFSCRFGWPAAPPTFATTTTNAGRSRELHS